ERTDATGLQADGGVPHRGGAGRRQRRSARAAQVTLRGDLRPATTRTPAGDAAVPQIGPPAAADAARAVAGRIDRTGLPRPAAGLGTLRRCQRARTTADRL